jgi:hypothetical protein
MKLKNREHMLPGFKTPFSECTSYIVNSTIYYCFVAYIFLYFWFKFDMHIPNRLSTHDLYHIFLIIFSISIWFNFIVESRFWRIESQSLLVRGTLLKRAFITLEHMLPCADLNFCYIFFYFVGHMWSYFFLKICTGKYQGDIYTRE